MATAKKAGKGKSWFKILAPKLFNENEICETICKDSENLIGRTISIPFSELGGDITRQNVKIKLKIERLSGENAHTEIVSYELSRPFLQRIMKRRVKKIDHTEVIKLKNGKKYAIKALGITLSRADSSQMSSLRREIIKELKATMNQFDIDSLVSTLAQGKLQREMQKRINKIYPLRFFEIRKIELVREKRKEERGTKDEKAVETQVEEITVDKQIEAPAEDVSEPVELIEETAEYPVEETEEESATEEIESDEEDSE